MGKRRPRKDEPPSIGALPVRRRRLRQKEACKPPLQEVPLYNDSVLRRFLDAAWSTLSTSDCNRIRNYVHDPEVQSLGTLCSGSGMAEIAHHCLLSSLGVEPRCLHACENVAWKQKHLLQNVAPRLCGPGADTPCLYADITGTPAGITRCEAHKKECEVPQHVFLLVVGYSCKQLSSIVHGVGETARDDVLMHGTGSSAKTCRAMLQYIRRQRPHVGILEH